MEVHELGSTDLDFVLLKRKFLYNLFLSISESPYPQNNSLDFAFENGVFAVADQFAPEFLKYGYEPYIDVTVALHFLNEIINCYWNMVKDPNSYLPENEFLYKEADLLMTNLRKSINL